MKRCKIAPPSCTRPDRPCCVDCPDKTCQNRCWNSPKRCGCWAETAPRREQGKKGGHSVNWDEIARLRGQGLTQKQIAKWLGCSQHAVANALRKMGVTKGG